MIIRMYTRNICRFRYTCTLIKCINWKIEKRNDDIFYSLCNFLAINELVEASRSLKIEDRSCTYVCNEIDKSEVDQRVFWSPKYWKEYKLRSSFFIFPGAAGGLVWKKENAKVYFEERKRGKENTEVHVLSLYESPLSTQACVHIEDMAVPWNESAMSRASVEKSRTNLAWKFREIHRNSGLTRNQSHPDNLTCSNLTCSLHWINLPLVCKHTKPRAESYQTRRTPTHCFRLIREFQTDTACFAGIEIDGTQPPLYRN